MSRIDEVINKLEETREYCEDAKEDSMGFDWAWKQSLDLLSWQIGMHVDTLKQKRSFMTWGE